MKRIKLLIMSGSLGPGGAEMQLARTATRLDRDRYDVTVAYYYKDNLSHHVDEIVKTGIRVVYLGGKKWNRTNFIINATKHIFKERYDIVHAWNAQDNHYARIPAILAKVPVIVGGFRGMYMLDHKLPRYYSLLNKYSNGIIVNSHEIKQNIMNNMKYVRSDDIVVIRNGIDLDIFDLNTYTNREFYRSLKADKKIIGIVGRLEPVKRQLDFLKMAKIISPRMRGIDFWILGEGSMQGALEQAAVNYNLNDRVKFFGRRDDVPAALSMMDLFVLTSHSEGCPNAMLEAMSASLPVITTRCTDLNGLVIDDWNGYRVDVGDVNGIAEKSLRILASATLGSRMGQRSRSLIDANYRLNDVVRRFEDTYFNFYNNSQKCSNFKGHAIRRAST